MIINVRNAVEMSIAKILRAMGIFMRYLLRSFTDAIIVITASTMLSPGSPKNQSPKATADIIISGMLNFLSVIFITLP